MQTSIAKQLPTNSAHPNTNSIYKILVNPQKVTTKLDKSEIEIHIPSELGYEKVVIASVAAIAKKIGFSQEKIEALKTALAEACTNAIEHGNSLDVCSRVSIVLTIGENSLTANVIDAGHKPIPRSLPDRSLRADFRGMGLFLIQMLMDKVEIKSQPGRNEIRMTSFLTPPS